MLFAAGSCAADPIPAADRPAISPDEVRKSLLGIMRPPWSIPICTAYLPAQPCRGGPECRSLPMKVPNAPLALHVVVVAIEFVGSFANARDIAISIDVTCDCRPSLACGLFEDRSIQPATLQAADHGEGEHARTRGLRPSLLPVQELAPHSVRALLLQQRAHHGLVAMKN